MRISYKRLRNAAVVLAALLVGSTSAYAEEVMTEEIATESVGNAAELLQAGDEVSGFKVLGVYDFPERNAAYIQMEHEKTGAQLVYIANEDTDKAFTVNYRTNIDNDKGIPHVFEHITLSGSGKYPNASLWDQMQSGTYNTFMNASTSTQHTSYMMASLSQEQLMAIADFYMAGLTDPLALRDEHPLGREAYRYELADAEDEIIVTGAVFSEMEAANANINRFTLDETLKKLYPDSVMGSNTGGVREDIVTITLEELQEFYDTYYHPSNMLLLLYGDIDYVPFLEMLDQEYLSKYEKKEINLEDAHYQPWEGYETYVVPYPAEEGAIVEESGISTYVIALDDISPEDASLMSYVLSILSQDNSSLQHRMQEEFPYAMMGCHMLEGIERPAANFVLQGSNEGDEERLKEIVQEELQKVAEEGLDQTLVESFVNFQEADLLISADDHGGVDLLNAIASSWTTFDGDPLAYLKKSETSSKLKEAAEEGKLDQLIKDYLVDPKQSVSVGIVPQPGLYEEQYAQFQSFLHEKKEAMSEEEIEALIASTEEFAAWSDQQMLEADVSTVTAVGVSDLPEEVEKLQIDVEEEDGIAIYTHSMEDAGYLSTSVRFAVNDLPVERIHDMTLLSSILCSMDTENYNADDFYVKLVTELYSSGLDIDILYDDETGEVIPYFCVFFTSLNDKVQIGYDLVEEMLFRIDLSDMNRLRFLINNELNYLKNDMNSDIRLYMMTDASARKDSNLKYRSYYNGYEYLKYLKKLVKMSDAELQEKVEDLYQTLHLILNKDQMVYTAVGDPEGISISRECIRKLAEKLDDTVYPAVDYRTEIPDAEYTDAFAMIISDSAYYNGYSIPNSIIGTKDDGKSTVINNVVESMIVYPLFRYNIGAYGGFAGQGETALTVLSYRDPGVAESFEALAYMGDYVEELELTQEDVDASILATYSVYSYPKTTQEQAEEEIEHILRKKPGTWADEVLANMQMAKAVTPDDVTAAADLYRTLVTEGVRYTAGNGTQIKANSELYDEIREEVVR